MKKMMKSKGMARGGGAKKKMKNGGKAMKAKGMSKGGMRGGRRMMMKNGGKAKGTQRGGAMTVAALRAAAKAKGYKLVKA